MKTTITFFTAAILLFAFIGCSNSNSSTNEEEQRKNDSIASIEKAKKDSVEAVRAIEKYKRDSTFVTDSLIKITSYYPTAPNSAQGVSYYLNFVNKNSSPVKYATFVVVPYNGVGDVVTCSIRSNSEFRGQVTGPINQNASNYGRNYWDCAWYNSTIKTIKVIKAEIEYMNGNKYEVDEDMISCILPKK